MAFVKGKGILSQATSLAQQKTPNKACSGLAGFYAIYKHFSGFGFFLLSGIILARPPTTNANRCTKNARHGVEGDQDDISMQGRLRPWAAVHTAGDDRPDQSTPGVAVLLCAGVRV